MIIAVCTIELDIPAASLKDKRRVVKSVITRLRNEFNISIAEVDHLDAWQTAVIAAVAVSTDADYVHGLMTKVVTWVERSRLDCEIADYQIELI